MLKKLIPTLLLCLSAILVLNADFSFAKESILFENISDVTKAAVMEKFPEISAGDLPYPILDEVIRFLSAQDDTDTVIAKQDSHGNIILEIRNRNIVDSIEIEGESNFSEEQLQTFIGIKAKDRFDRNKAIKAAEKIKNFYGENGFFNSIVDVEFVPKPDGAILLKYTIREEVPCRIKDIVILSSNENLNNRLKNRLRSFRKKNLNQENINKITERAKETFLIFSYLTATVEDAKLAYNEDKTEATLSFRVIDPYKWEFYLNGNLSKTTSELFMVLDLSNKDRRNIDPVNEAIDRLRRYYLAEGYPHIQIRHTLTTLDPFHLRRAYFQINEGPKARIAQFLIEGRFSRPESYYVDFIEQYSSPLIQRGVYNRQDLDKGLENMIAFLKNQGFLRARIQSSRTEFSKDLSKAQITINLDEGALTQIQAVSFEGNSFFSERELVSVFGLQTSAPLRLKDLEEGIQKIKTFYSRQGFLEMKVLNEDKTLVQYNSKGTLADIRFRIFEGPRVRVAEIVLEGNTFTQRRVIMREMNIKRGQVLNPEIIEGALDRLNRLGIFSRVDIKTLEEGTSVADRTLIVQVQERDPGLFRMGLGANNERELTARGFIGLGYNNLWGTARGISGRAELNYNIARINYPETEFSLGYLEPFLLGSRTRGRVNLTRSERVFEYQPDSENLTSITLSEKVEFFAERDFSKTFRGSWKVWSLDRRRDFEKDGRCIDPPDCDSTPQQIAKIGPILDWDYRDNPFLPSKGTFSRAQVEFSHPGLGSSKNLHFYKADAQHTRYVRLGESSFVWANSIRGGYLKNLSDAEGSGIPASQAFFLGGVFTVRGFDASSNNERIPPEYELGFKKSTELIIDEDSYYGLFKSELRFTISGDFGAALFYDGGMVQVTHREIERPYRDAVGFGIRYNTPVGPVSLDLAFKIRPKQREDTYRVHFSIGSF